MPTAAKSLTSCQALQGVAPFGSFVIGWIAQTWNVPTAIVVGGAVCLLGIVAIRLIFRGAREPSG